MTLYFIVQERSDIVYKRKVRSGYDEGQKCKTFYKIKNGLI